MKKLGLIALVLSLSALCLGQTINASQYQVNLSFLTGGPYAQSSALDVTFGTQFTTNNRLQADFITMPSANYTGYTGGNSYNLCGISAVENMLATTSFSCGKFEPFLTGEGGLGRLQVGSAPSTVGPAALIGLGVGWDATGKGNFGLLFKGGWGHFGPTVAATSLNPAMSGNGFYFYSGFNFGGGSSASATAAKVERINRASAKKLKKLQRAAAKADRS